jgi:hypothetical protein
MVGNAMNQAANIGLWVSMRVDMCAVVSPRMCSRNVCDTLSKMCDLKCIILALWLLEHFAPMMPHAEPLPCAQIVRAVYFDPLVEVAV